jgi:hypothetical protein
LAGEKTPQAHLIVVVKKTFKPGAKHPVTPAPIKALPCLCIFPPMAEKSKPPALRVVGDPEHYYGKRCNFAFTIKIRPDWIDMSRHCSGTSLRLMTHH